jgi:Flp pilus assembly pilin Flp
VAPVATPNRKEARKLARGGNKYMNAITKLVVRAREYHRGQTMAEYALIMAAVAVVVFVGYQTMGTTITSLLTTVDGKL